MIDNLEETTLDNETETLFWKSPGLNNAKNYVLTHKRFITDLVLIFSDLRKTHIYKMPYRDSSHHEIEILISFNYLNAFKPNDKIILFEIEDRK